MTCAIESESENDPDDD